VLSFGGIPEGPLIDTEPTEQPEVDDVDYAVQGETPDPSALNALQLAHKVLNKFPDLTKRYQKFIGTAAVVSSALIVLTSIAVARRLNRGESEEDILNSITPEEIENAGKQKPEKPKERDRGDQKRRFFH
jgi:hypothetical protein